MYFLNDIYSINCFLDCQIFKIIVYKRDTYIKLLDFVPFYVQACSVLTLLKYFILSSEFEFGFSVWVVLRLLLMIVLKHAYTCSNIQHEFVFWIKIIFCVNFSCFKNFSQYFFFQENFTNLLFALFWYILSVILPAWYVNKYLFIVLQTDLYTKKD